MGAILDYTLGMPSDDFFGCLGILLVLAGILGAVERQAMRHAPDRLRATRRAVRGPSDPERLRKEKIP